MTDNSPMTIEQARNLASRFPWFDVAQLALHNCGETLPPRIEVLSRFRPAILSAVPPAIGENNTEVAEEEDTMAIIDEFIRSGEHRITANDATPDVLPAADNADDAIPDELLTEDFAAIYLAQGMNDRAVEIYRRLSLLNPEKSIYFAELIEKASMNGHLSDDRAGTAGKKTKKNN